ncbi:MAG: aldo/keto reductase [Coriobacteriales bacterium]|nr:aldo/keto reductase [Coriobacteriales bacterium]
MQYRKDKYGNKLSVLGFGCMRLPRTLAASEKLIVDACAAGINYFDTAYVYPGSEETLGKIVEKNALRDRIYIASKLPHQKCSSVEDVQRIFSEQLQRLRTSKIDYYLIHNIANISSWQRLVDFGFLDWLLAKQAEGAIGQIGFSYHGKQGDFKPLLDAYDWDFCQIQYNYANANYQAGQLGLKAAAARGIPVIIMEPLLGGKLANDLSPAAAKLFKAVHADRSLASWGFRWLYNQEEVTLVLSGMNASEQLADNLQAASEACVGMLSAEEEAVYEPVLRVFQNANKIACTGCNYCMPCSQNVNIPDCFAAYNVRHTMGFVTGLTQYITSAVANPPDKQALASKCTGCKACLKKCPQGIAIPDELALVRKSLEPWWFGLVVGVVRKFTS